jgi:hypothetical protein
MCEFVERANVRQRLQNVNATDLLWNVLGCCKYIIFETIDGNK